MCVVRRHLSCCAVRLGYAKHFMDETHIGSSCFPPAVLALPLLCVEDQEVRPMPQPLLPSKLMKKYVLTSMQASICLLLPNVMESEFFWHGCSVKILLKY